MTTYTKLGADGEALPADATGHQAVRVDHPLLAKPLIFTAHRSPKELTYIQAIKYAEKLKVNKWSWRAPTAHELPFLRDLSKYPTVDVNFFPDFTPDEWDWADSTGTAAFSSVSAPVSSSL
jgi:hypothetical protein